MKTTRLISMKEAVTLVKPGDTLALGGVMLYRRPVGFVYELLRQTQPPTDLTILSFTAGYEADLLIGAGCASRTRTCYFGLEAFGFAPMFTQAANQGKLQIIEETEASLALGMRAQMAGVGFMPSTAWLGTDLLKLRPDVKTVVDPYNGQEVVAFPAISADVAVLHARAADRRGNVRLNNNLGIDPELAVIGKEVIVTAEEIVDSLSSDIAISGALITAVVAAPRGAWPTSCYPDYPMAGGEIMRYVEACANGQFDDYLQQVAAKKA
ncbi:MAG TPA: CoA-transferase [Aggregatilineaceae bacterium]|nr:CoA-transferase [Aggregatilineaceae bacterium]